MLGFSELMGCTLHPIIFFGPHVQGPVVGAKVEQMHARLCYFCRPLPAHHPCLFAHQSCTGLAPVLHVPGSEQGPQRAAGAACEPFTPPPHGFMKHPAPLGPPQVANRTPNSGAQSQHSTSPGPLAWRHIRVLSTAGHSTWQVAPTRGVSTNSGHTAWREMPLRARPGPALRTSWTTPALAALRHTQRRMPMVILACVQ